MPIRSLERQLPVALLLVTVTATPGAAQTCEEMDSGLPRPQFMLERLPECGGTAPEIPSQPQGGAFSLTTLFASNNGFAGSTFDLEVVGSEVVVIAGFEVNIETGLSGPKTVTVYYRQGTSAGFENDPLAWTLMGSESGIVAAGADNPTPVNVGGLGMDPGQVYGIYVDLTSYDGGDAMLYTNGGPTVFSTAELQLTTNTGQGSPAFSGSFFPRQWNGTVYYDVVPFDPADIPALGAAGLIVLLAGLCGAGLAAIRRRRDV